MKTSKQKILIDFSKARSSILNIIEMIERGEQSINIMQNNLSAFRLLKSVQKNLTRNYIVLCFSNGIMAKEGKNRGEMVKEILKVTKLYNR